MDVDTEKVSNTLAAGIKATGGEGEERGEERSEGEGGSPSDPGGGRALGPLLGGPAPPPDRGGGAGAGQQELTSPALEKAPKAMLKFYVDLLADCRRERDSALAERDTMRMEWGFLSGVVPQTFGEAVMHYGPGMVDCEPHEWDNRTTVYNAIWLLERLVALNHALGARLGTRADAAANSLACDRAIERAKAAERERDALMALLVKEEVHHDAATGTYPPTGRWWVVPYDDAFGGDVFEDRGKAVASVWRDACRAVRKAAGLGPDPKAEGVEPPG
jgi:hypothetical protein